MGGYFLPDSISGLTKQRLLSYEPESDARFLSQLLKAQGYVPQGEKVTTTATSPVTQSSLGGRSVKRSAHDTDLQTPDQHTKRPRNSKEEQSDAEASDSDADGPASAEPSGVEAEAEAAATAAQLAAEARKAHQVAKLVNIANQADHTPIMLDKNVVVLPRELSRHDIRLIMYNVLDIFGTTSNEKSIITRNTIQQLGFVQERKTIKEQLDQMQNQYDDARTRTMLLEGELRELQETDTQQQMYDLQNQVDTLRQDKARLEQQLRTFDQMKQMLQG